MIRSGLIVNANFANLILDGVKTHEMRASTCTKREWIGIIPKASGTVTGVVRITGSSGPFDFDELASPQARGRHQTDPELLVEKGWQHAWELADAYRFPKPVPFAPQSGPVIFVTLDATASRDIGDLMTARAMARLRSQRK